MAFRGWGRGLRKAIGDWYQSKSPSELAFQVIKYQQRDGWSHADLLRLAHPKPVDAAHDSLYKWIVDGELKEVTTGLEIVQGYMLLQQAKTAQNAAELVEQYALPMEAVPTQFKDSIQVWRAALPHLGLTALIRNLGNLSKYGLLKQGAPEVQQISTRLLNQENLRAARIHPIAILSALITYSSGQSARGSGKWEVVPDIVDALDRAFYLSFGNVTPTNKDMVLALDVSGSMAAGTVSGVPGLTPRAAAAAMAMVTYTVEPKVSIVAFQAEGASLTRGFVGYFSREAGIVPLNISRHKSLQDVVEATNNLPFGPTDCAQPMLWASKNRVKAEAFIILTDNETWAGDIHPIQALNDYRNEFKIPAKLVVVAMTASEFSIADPNDAGMLDCCGFDTSTPSIISDFIQEPVEKRSS